MKYNWQQPDWLRFNFDTSKIEDFLYDFTEKAGLIRGLLTSVPQKAQEEALVEVLVSEAVKTSEIENEYLSREDVTSSIRNNLGLVVPHEKVKDSRAKGIGQMMTEIRRTYHLPLMEETLMQWHRMIFAGQSNIETGKWRTHTAPMQVISGAIGNEKVHFEAPPSVEVPKQMGAFIRWLNNTSPQGTKPIKHAPIRAAIAHLYFETIHPFEDGNGRIGRAIADKTLSQSVGYPLLMSLSATIEKNKKAYYTELKKAQRSNEITPWLIYFLQVILEAQQQTENLVHFTLKKARFFDLHQDQLNERQLKTIKRIFQAGPEGFQGGMTAKKHMHINKTSKATATRDLQKLERLGILTAQGGGRSTHYGLTGV